MTSGLKMSNKTLGYGHLKETGHGLFIEDADVAKVVEFSLDAFSFNPNRGNERPKNGEYFVYTAYLIDNRYRIHSACRPADLKCFEGYLVELSPNNKYAHFKPKNGNLLIFVPYSSRGITTKSWYGVDAKKNKLYTVMAFRQPEMHGCTYVAWSIVEGSHKQNLVHPLYMEVDHREVAGKVDKNGRQSDHQSIEFVTKQLGIIYEVSDSNVVTVTSPTCQDAYFSPSLFSSWMKPGRFITFDGRRVDDAKGGKLMGSNPVDCGTFFPYDTLYPLAITVDAILCRVDDKQVIAWNDLIGRIFIPCSLCDRQKKPLPFTAVNLAVTYVGKHENTPWIATSVSFLDQCETEEVLEKYANMLITEDNWKVFSVIDGPENPSYFLTKFDDQGQKVNAFAKKIDINYGEVLNPNTPVRVTFYAQKRHHKHAMRAVLVTSLDKLDRYPKIHRFYTGSGVICQPEPVEPATERPKPVVASPTPRLLAAPPPKKNCWNMKNLGRPVGEASTASLTTTYEAQKQMGNILSFSPAPLSAIGQRVHHRPTSMWHGTPVEAKSNPVSFSHESVSYLDSGNILPELNISDEPTLGSTSQPSTASTSGPFGELRNSLNSSPELRMDADQTIVAQTEEDAPNAWSSLNIGTAITRGNSVNSDQNSVANASLIGGTSFQTFFNYGFPQMDIPIYSRIQPHFNDILMPKEADRSSSSAVTSCCDAEQLLWDLWENPHFVAAFSVCDPVNFRRIQAKRQTFLNVNRISRNNNHC